jgi:hypothetical protein
MCTRLRTRSVPQIRWGEYVSRIVYASTTQSDTAS